jgi:hypothetical protein
MRQKSGSLLLFIIKCEHKASQAVSFACVCQNKLNVSSFCFAITQTMPSVYDNKMKQAGAELYLNSTNLSYSMVICMIN